MANWIFYLKDQANVVMPTFTAMSNGANCTHGLATMTSAFTGASSTILWNFGAGVTKKIKAVGWNNHNMPDTTAITLSHSSNGSTWTDGTAANPSGYATGTNDYGFTVSRQYWKVTIADAALSGKVIGSIALLDGSENQTIEIEASYAPRYPIGISMDAGIGVQRTITGNRIEQVRGGAYHTFSLNCMFIPRTGAATATDIFPSFLDSAWGVAGWPGPFYISDDAGVSYQVHLVRPIMAPIMNAGGRCNVTLNFETVPSIGAS
jgi:hypothetical protein